MIVLRDYQQAAIDELRANYQAGIKSQLLVSPTGSGKTVMFASMTQHAERRNKRIWICAHRVELLDQIGATLDQFSVPFGEISPHKEMTDHRVQVASIFTLARRTHLLPRPDLIIMDEAHHCVSTTTWGRVLTDFPEAYVLGVTATPERLNGQGLGQTFQTMTLGPSTASLIEQGSLSRYELFRPPSDLSLKGLRRQGGDWAKGELDERVRGSSIMGDAVSHYQQHCLLKRALVFCVSVQHANEVAQSFRSHCIPAISIDGKTEASIRKKAIEDLASGQLKVLVSCDLISEGFDCPSVEAAFLLRPTNSLALYLQQVGRSLRAHPGKERTLIFDHAGNSKKHGLPDDERDWSLEGFSEKRAKISEFPVRTCKNCFAVIRPSYLVCPYCKVTLPIKERMVEIQEGSLEKVDPELARMQAKAARQDQGRTRTMEELIALGKQRGYANPQAWAYHVFKARQR